MLALLLLACTATPTAIGRIPLPHATDVRMPQAVKIGVDREGVWVEAPTWGAPRYSPIDGARDYALGGDVDVPALRELLQHAGEMGTQAELALYLAGDAPSGAALHLLGAVAKSGYTDHVWLAAEGGTGVRVTLPSACAEAAQACNLTALVASADGWWLWSERSTAVLPTADAPGCTVLPPGLDDDGWFCPPHPDALNVLGRVPDACPTLLVGPGHPDRPWAGFHDDLADLAEPGRAIVLATIGVPTARCEDRP